VDRSPLATIPEWLLRALLVVPFVAVIAVERGLTRTFPVFHGSDETNSYYPVIREFANQLPWVHLQNYRATTGPLFMLVFAVLGKLVGLELWRLRLGEVVVSYLLVLATYHVLRRDVGLDKTRSFVLAAAFELSPYVFGPSFRLLTWNMAALFAVLAIHWTLSFSRTERWRDFVAFGIAAGLAVLTRQLFVWLFPIGGVLMLLSHWSVRAKALGSFLLALCVVPLLALVVAWHGFLPQSYRAAHEVASPDYRGGLFALAIFGIYSLAFDTTEWMQVLRVDWMRHGRVRHLVAPIGFALVGLVILLARPIGNRSGDDGWLWRISRALPHDLPLIVRAPGDVRPSSCSPVPGEAGFSSRCSSSSSLRMQQTRPSTSTTLNPPPSCSACWLSSPRLSQRMSDSLRTPNSCRGFGIRVPSSS
jgi:hypothetical protein